MCVKEYPVSTTRHIRCLSTSSLWHLKALNWAALNSETKKQLAMFTELHINAVLYLFYTVKFIENYNKVIIKDKLENFVQLSTLGSVKLKMGGFNCDLHELGNIIIGYHFVQSPQIQLYRMAPVRFVQKRNDLLVNLMSFITQTEVFYLTNKEA